MPDGLQTDNDGNASMELRKRKSLYMSDVIRAKNLTLVVK
jgi:hypothetical protein